jgi:PAS domain S-box-containing protein
MQEKNNTHTLQKNLIFFETLLHASADGILITDPAKKIIFVNETFCKFFSSNKQDVLETNLFLWLGKLDNNARDIWKGLENQVNEHGIAKDVEFTMKAEKGKRYYSVNSSHLEKIDIEETGLIISIWHDITERKVAKKAFQQAHDNLEMSVQERTAQLSESEAKYRMLFEYSNDVVAHVDRYGKILAVNNKLEEMFCFKPEDVIGKYFFNIGVLRLRDLPQVIQLFKNTVRKGMTMDKKGKLPEKVDLELRNKNGKSIFVETSTTILRKDGNIDGFLVNIRDITESKQAKEQLKASEEKYSTLVEKGNDGIIILQDDLLKYVNSKICEMTGFTREELIGKPFLTHASEEYKKLVREKYEKTLRGDNIPNVYEIEIVSKNGLKMPFEINASLIEYEGRPASMAILRDISQRKQAETLLRIQKDIASSLSIPGDTDIMLDQILKALSHIEGVDSGGLYISDRLTGDLILRVHYGFSSEFVQEVSHYAPDTPNWRLVHAGQPSYLKYSEEIKKRPYLMTEGLRGVAVIPVVLQGHVIGSLNMGSHTLDEIPVHARNILETIAGQLESVIARIKSEEELKDTKNYLGTIIKSSYDSIFVVDDEGRFEFGNEAFFDMMDYTENEIVGHSFMKVIHPDYHDFILKRWDEVQRGEGKPYEVDIVRKDGTVRSLSVSHTDMELGGKRKYCVIAKDMTERKRMEEALRKSEQQYHTILQTALDGFWVVDMQGRFIDVNEAYCKIIGYSREELLRMNIQDVDLLEKESATRHHIQKVIDNRSDFFETRHRRKDGRIVDVEVSVNILPDEGKLFVFLRDITHRKLADDALRESEQLLKEAQRIGKLGSLNWNLNTNELILSDEALEIYGLDKEKKNYVLDEITALLHPDDRDRVVKSLTAAVSDRAKHDMEHRMLRPDGKEIQIQATAELLRDADGKPVRLIGIIQDITQRKQAEEALRASLEEKTVLLHEVHHRVKNNLQIVSSLLNLQATRIKNKEAIEALRETGNRIQSMALLHETLNISGNLSTVNFSIYIKNICVNIIRSYGSKAENIKLENHIADIAIDLDQAVPCGLIINELVSNALKHAFPEGRKGRITVELQALPDDQIKLNVADDGIGLPQGLDIGQTETLGLKLVTILTDKLKGSVEVIRDPGTTFYIMFKGKMNAGGQL